MNLNWRHILTLVLWLGCFLFLVGSNCGHTKKPAGVNSDTISYWQTKYGDLVASQRKSEEDFAIINKQLRDSLAKRLDIKPKTIREYVTVYQSATADLDPVRGSKAADYFAPAAPNCPPGISSFRQMFRNPWYQADVRIGDSSYCRIWAKDSLNIVWHTVSTGNIFKRRTYLQADVFNTNPDVTIQGLHTYRVMETKPKKFGLGLQVGYGFSKGLQPSVTFSVGLSYNPIRF